MLLFIAEEKRKQEFFKARGLLKEQKEGTYHLTVLLDDRSRCQSIASR